MSDGWITAAEWTVLAVSLKVSIWATVLTLPFAVWLALLLSRPAFRGQQFLNILVHLPLVLPPVVTGYALLNLFGRRGVFGAWLYDSFGVSLAFTQSGAIIAAGVMALPLMVRAIRLGRDAVSSDLLQASATLGASATRRFWTITLPLMWPSVLAGVVLGWAKALGEFGATITFVSAIPGQTETIPAAIYTLLQNPGSEGAVHRLVICSVLLSVGALVLSEWLVRRARVR